MKIKEILEVTGGKPVNINENIKIKNFVIDSRKAKEGSFFIPLKGSKFDGHQFIQDALQKGACGYLSSKPSNINGGILVDDTLKALSKIAVYKRKQFDRVIGITGTSGKTTTKELTTFVLSKILKVSSSFGNYNNHIGLPFSLANANENSKVGVYELGTSQKGDIKSLMEILKPEIGVLTSVGYAHTQGLKKFEDIVYEKGNIFLNVEFAVLPDNLLPYYEADLPPKYVTFGFEEDADIKIFDVHIFPEGTQFTISYKKDKKTIKLPVLSESVSLNVGALAGILYALDINPIKTLELLEDFQGISGRGNIIKAGSNIIIDDSYNANPLSVFNAIKTLSKLKSKKVLVLGDMLELGDLSEKLHKEIGMIIDRSNIDEVYLYGDHVIYTKQQIKTKPTFLHHSKEEIVKKLSGYKDSIILIKGSRGMKMEEIITKLINK